MFLRAYTNKFNPLRAMLFYSISVGRIYTPLTRKLLMIYEFIFRFKTDFRLFKGLYDCMNLTRVKSDYKIFCMSFAL